MPGQMRRRAVAAEQGVRQRPFPGTEQHRLQARPAALAFHDRADAGALPAHAVGTEYPGARQYEDRLLIAIAEGRQAAHLLGTARMGTDPARSVVNEWGRSHDVRNLFIVDGSVFVTSGGVNPTSTIQAIALYIADQMKQRLATLFDD